MRSMVMPLTRPSGAGLSHKKWVTEMKTGPRITLEKKCEDLYFLKTDTTPSYQIYKKIINP